MLDEWDRNADKARELGLAMVAGRHREPEEVFPQYFDTPEVDAQVDPFTDPEAGLDFSKVEHTPMTEEQYEELERLMLAAEETVEGSPEDGETDGGWI